MLVIRRADSPSDVDDVRTLMRAFVSWHRERHTEDLALIDQYFDPTKLDAELAGLPDNYTPPDGQILLARYDGASAGCVAMRRIDDHVCEMKRMFIYPQMRGKNIGRALGEAIIGDARASGYQAMRLDASWRQSEAQALYSKLGFRPIEPYYDCPAALRDWLVFYELAL